MRKHSVYLEINTIDILPEDIEGIAIEPVQPILRCKPHVAMRVLKHIKDTVLRETAPDVIYPVIIRRQKRDTLKNYPKYEEGTEKDAL